MTDEGLLRAATALRASDPSAWAALLDALARRVGELSLATVQAPVNMVQVCQGRAQECITLQGILATAHETLDKRAARKHPE